MFKNILLSTLVCASLNAQSFEIFLQNAIQNSPYLKANSLNVKQAKELSTLTTRYKNPTLALEVSNFSPDIGDNDIGYRAALSQPIRLWGVGANQESLANAQIEETQSLLTLSRAHFIAKLSSLYINYKSSVCAVNLAKEELLISKKIAFISKTRYEAGTIARVKFIQAKVDTARVATALTHREAEKVSAYYSLLGFAGLYEEEEIETSYRFILSETNNLENSAQIAYMKKQGLRAEAEAELNANKLEWINLYGEFEQEPDQSIARVGVAIPLAIFNTKSQERRVAQLEAKKVSLITENISNAKKMKLRELAKSLSILKSLHESSQKLLSSQEELLKIYEEAYKVANIDLIELQMIKNQMILTKEKIIKIKQKQEQKIVEHNLLTGEYND